MGGWGQSWDRKQALALKVEVEAVPDADDKLISELASDLGRLSLKDLETVYNEVVNYLENLEELEFANSCHGEDGRFCETPGGARYPNPLKGKKVGESASLVLGTLKTAWKEKVSTLVKFNAGLAVASAGAMLISPGLKAELVYGSPIAIYYLGAGLLAMLWNQSKGK